MISPLIALLLLACNVGASDQSAVAAILRQEQNWLGAYHHHDAKTLGAILADGFVHVNYLGEMRDRSEELSAVPGPVSFEERTSQQTVCLVGGVAIVHGLNTITEKGKVVARLRYGDIYVLEGGVWRALSAQETVVKSTGS
jgi:hypothetical protein